MRFSQASGQKKGGSGVEMASLVRSGRYTWPVLILFGILTKHSRYATSALPWGGSSSVICAIGVWALHVATDRPVLRTLRTTLFDNCFHRMHSGNRVLKSAAWCPARLLYAGSRGALTAVVDPGAHGFPRCQYRRLAAGKPWRGPFTWSPGTLFPSPIAVYHQVVILQRKIELICFYNFLF